MLHYVFAFYDLPEPRTARPPRWLATAHRDFEARWAWLAVHQRGSTSARPRMRLVFRQHGSASTPSLTSASRSASTPAWPPLCGLLEINASENECTYKNDRSIEC